MVNIEQIDDWEDPPEGVNTADPRHRYTKVVERLKQNKGVWARLAPRENDQAAKSLALNIRRGRLATFAPEGAFEAHYRDSLVWVRFVGMPDGVEAKRKYVAPDRQTDRAVRTWARATGRQVSDRGRLSSHLIAEWKAATRGESV